MIILMWFRLTKLIKDLIDEIVLPNKERILFIWYHEILWDDVECSSIYYQSYHVWCVRLKSGEFMRYSTHFILLFSYSYRYARVCAAISSSLLHSSNPMSPTSRSILKWKYGNHLSTSMKWTACLSRRCVFSEFIMSFDNVSAILSKTRMPVEKFVIVFQSDMNTKTIMILLTSSIGILIQSA